MTAPTPQQAESWLPFVERVGLPWVAFFVVLMLLAISFWYFSSKLLPELKAIALALQASSTTTKQLSDEIHSGNTPPLGTPVLPSVLLDIATTLGAVKEALAEIRQRTHKE